ncbi:MAG: peptidyl-prolyl cis-trans isomerase [Bacteroidales bacterium]|jgi:hypothetical protein|nr:peptidyl-prolyl cis-trans isomerase [Bacteroidales bacterium]
MFRKVVVLVVTSLVVLSCTQAVKDDEREALLEVEGKFLYRDQVDAIIPPNVSESDSAQIADAYIRKWATDVLLYENAKRNVDDKAAIDALLEDYRKSLTIHQYQQKLIQQRLPKEVSEDEVRAFYEQYSDQFVLREPYLKGLLLVVPVGAPDLNNVRSWVRSGNAKAVENIEKYSMKNALSYTYFFDRWMSYNELQKKMPVQPHELQGVRFIELSDSSRHYMLNIQEVRKPGETEPFEIAQPRISEIILNKLKSEFVSGFEKELYNDAVNNGTITFFNEQN